MLVTLIILLLLTAFLPLFVKPIEHHIEMFLLCMGILTAAIAGGLTMANIGLIFENRFLYIITGAVLVVSFLFRLFEKKIKVFSQFLLERLPLKLIVFSLIVLLGLLSSVITAIIAALLLTEFVTLLPLSRRNKIIICIVACFAIGLGAVLTPIGEPLSTVVVTKLNQNFSYMLNLLGVYTLFGILSMGVLGMFFADNNWRETYRSGREPDYVPEKETSSAIFMRAGKIFIFVVALELLGYGFKPLIDTYIIHWSNGMLYGANMISAILDNATLAAAEISPVMMTLQIKTILVSLLVSGGMLVTGNIPNIITAGKLKISMKEWAKVGTPVGLVLLMGYYLVMFAF
ncbi:MAG: DUF1646 family protein [Clostridia bacterium]|nr:DUF1646 family protein [Clostridia bacterium]MDR3645886.1 DUF1646 family protein [Clostridia bacterium]